MTPEQRAALDAEAKANLSDASFREYEATRDELLADGTPDAELILGGLIIDLVEDDERNKPPCEHGNGYGCLLCLDRDRKAR